MTHSDRFVLGALGYAIWLLIGLLWLRRRKRRVLARLDDGTMTNDDIARLHGDDPEVRVLVRDGRIYMGVGIAFGLVLQFML